MQGKCGNCGKESSDLKRGWTCSLYCSEKCERSSVSRLHATMPGAGPLPRPNWVPHSISLEIEKRWGDEDS